MRSVCGWKLHHELFSIFFVYFLVWVLVGFFFIEIFTTFDAEETFGCLRNLLDEILCESA